ncbi:hypothetical protein [uncultured Gammaproteobacteria bacterium]|uniref:hypothetical protein n=1 Tax=Bathymodiolus heckerae thiotrophic gill symbiont TaxID=1052212 RepID=UPI0010BB5278|nr:hypothetical protein [Bathymodiolus heckerae thiotrophic gill symbiont]CAC9585699.1 hypothetical protein [uncultured Gammaproteobacteria bacterium]CAC9604903.1 hypothetical protein [uncultured Gammaproteobacteria bacterium]SHN89505.1 hypothetical protein BHECKSOX_1991 [Bathymodiolus heckerae thiotrophic gill symbiont]
MMFADKSNNRLFTEFMLILFLLMLVGNIYLFNVEKEAAMEYKYLLSAVATLGSIAFVGMLYAYLLFGIVDYIKRILFANIIKTKLKQGIGYQHVAKLAKLRYLDNEQLERILYRLLVICDDEEEMQTVNGYIEQHKKQLQFIDFDKSLSNAIQTLSKIDDSNRSTQTLWQVLIYETQAMSKIHNKKLKRQQYLTLIGFGFALAGFIEGVIKLF